MGKILHHLLYNDDILNLNQLNQRIIGFKYDKWENKPTQILDTHLKTKLKMSSAEMVTFTYVNRLFLDDN